MKLKYSLTILICYFSILCFAQKERVTSIYLKHDELNTSLIEERCYDNQDRLVKTTTYRYNPYRSKCLADSVWSYDTKFYEYNESGDLICETEYSKDKLDKKRVKVTDSKSSITKEYRYITESKRKNGLEIKETRIDTSILEWIKFNKGKVTEKRVYPKPLDQSKYVQENWTYKGSFLQQYSIENFYSESIKKHNYTVLEYEKMTIYYRADLDSIPDRIEFSKYQDNIFEKRRIYNFDLEGRVVEELEFDEEENPDYSIHSRYYYFGKYEYGYSCRSRKKMDVDISNMDCDGLEFNSQPLDYNWEMYTIDTSYVYENHEKRIDYAKYEQTKDYVIGYENEDLEESFVYLYKNRDSILYSNVIFREEKQEYDKEKKIFRSIVYGQEKPSSCQFSYGKTLETITDSLRKTKTQIIYSTLTSDTPHPIEEKSILDWATDRPIRKIEYVVPTNKISRITVYGYNSNGDLISEKDSVVTIQKRKEIQHEYYKAGLRKSTKTSVKGNYDVQENFEYAPDGNLKKSEKITTYKNGEKYGEIVLYYSNIPNCRIHDLSGAQYVININNLDKPAKFRDSSIVRYDPQSKIIEERRYSKTKLVDGYFDEYNERGQLTRSYNNERRLDVHLIYDSIGRLVEKEIYRPGVNPILENHEVYIHNFLPLKLETYKNLSIKKMSN